MSACCTAGQLFVEQVGDALRELRDKKQDDDQQQHAGCARVGSSTTVIPSLATSLVISALIKPVHSLVFISSLIHVLAVIPVPSVVLISSVVPALAAS